MSVNGFLQIAVFFGVLTALVPLLGGYMARVYQGESLGLAGRVLGPVERGAYRLLRVDPGEEQDWKGYARSTLLSGFVFFLVLLLILRTQRLHPFNPHDFVSAPWDVMFNTTASFVSNTNWQYYSGETTLTYFSQMAGLAVQNFVSAAVGMAVLVAVIRGLSRRSGKTLGNYWVDMIRTLLYILLPLSVIVGLILVSQGVVQTLGDPAFFGPAASQVAIKQLGTNGGGFFNVNSAMPFENPTALSNFVECLAILLIPAALTATYGRMVGSRRQGWVIYAAMVVMLAGAVVVTYAAEQHGSPALIQNGLDLTSAGGTTGGNLQDVDQRIGITDKSIWAAWTTAASNGSVNSGHEAFTGIGALPPLVSMMSGEVIFGGVGSGLYGMLLFVLLTVFVAGLMVGRTPEYLGKKVEAVDVKYVALGILAVPVLVLVWTALGISTDYGTRSIFNAGPHGFSETLYAYTSQGNNNGSAFAGYTGFVQPEAGNRGALPAYSFANVLGGIAMLFSRYIPILAVIALAGNMVRKQPAPFSHGTFRTDSPTFVVLLVGIVLIVAALTFVPALALGPLAEGMTDRLF